MGRQSSRSFNGRRKSADCMLRLSGVCWRSARHVRLQANLQVDPRTLPRPRPQVEVKSARGQATRFSIVAKGAFNRKLSFWP